MKRGKQILLGFILSFVGLMLSAIAGEILHINWLKKWLMVICIFPWAMLVGRNLFFILIEMQIAFHQKYNAKNINKVPISWVIRNEAKLKKIILGIWLAGAIFTALAIIINA